MDECGAWMRRVGVVCDMCMCLARASWVGRGGGGDLMRGLVWALSIMCKHGKF